MKLFVAVFVILMHLLLFLTFPAPILKKQIQQHTVWIDKDTEESPRKVWGNDGFSLVADPCPGKDYIGIGVIVHWNVISFVGNSTPAQRAGLKPGDMFVDVFLLDKIVEGVILTTTIIREGVEMVIKLKPEKICHD